MPPLAFATPDDIPSIMAIERRPGYDDLVGRWSAAEHHAEMTGVQGTRHLVARACDLVARERDIAARERDLVAPGENRLVGFVILQGLGGANRCTTLRRIAVGELSSLAWLKPRLISLFSSEINAAQHIECKQACESLLGRGIGAGLLVATLGHVFAETPTHRLQLLVYDDNARAARAYARVGFCAEGLMRDVRALPDGRFRSMHLMSILRPDWAAAQPNRPAE